jgi:hypothetical protein
MSLALSAEPGPVLRGEVTGNLLRPRDCDRASPSGDIEWT